MARDSGLNTILCSGQELTFFTNRYASQTAKDVFLSQVHPDTLRNFRSAPGLNSRRFNDKSLVRKKWFKFPIQGGALLSKEDNEFACRVGPGTPMGELFRRFWVPAMPRERLGRRGVANRLLKNSSRLFKKGQMRGAREN